MAKHTFSLNTFRSERSHRFARASPAITPSALVKKSIIFGSLPRLVRLRWSDGYCVTCARAQLSENQCWNTDLQLKSTTGMQGQSVHTVQAILSVCITRLLNFHLQSCQQKSWVPWKRTSKSFSCVTGDGASYKLFCEEPKERKIVKACIGVARGSMGWRPLNF